jgi:WD40 repeat protein
MTMPTLEGKRFISLTDLRDHHYAMLKQTAELTTARIVDFVGKARETGIILPDATERDSVQSILNYWSAELIRRGFGAEIGLLRDFDPLVLPDLDDELCPYVGLRAFDEDEKLNFFGRRVMVEKVANVLLKQHLVIVSGASGSGKSSIVRAGAVPMMKDRSVFESVITLVPGAAPLSSLAKALGNDAPSTSAVEQLVRDLLAGESCLADVLSQQGKRALVIVDQFEEIFTLAGDQVDVQKAFVANLLVLTEIGAGHGVIITVRDDYEGFFPKIERLNEQLDACRVRVDPPDGPSLRDAILGPAERIGLHFEDGLLDDLVRRVLGEPAGLPLLQFTLRQLWGRRDRNRITWAAYKQVGIPRDALKNTAESVYDSFTDADRRILKNVFMRLVRPGEYNEIVSNRVLMTSVLTVGIPSQVQRVMDRLVHLGLLRLTGQNQDDAQVEVTHEALIRNWPRLMEWVQDQRNRMRERLRFTSAAEAWDASGRDAGGLLAGRRLRGAELFDELNATEREFVEASRQAERAAEQSRARGEAQKLLWRNLAIGLLLIIVAAVVLEFFRDHNKQLRNNQKLYSRELALLSQLEQPNQRNTGLALALKAVYFSRKVQQKPIQETETSLDLAIQTGRKFQFQLPGDITFNSDGTRAVTSSGQLLTFWRPSEYQTEGGVPEKAAGQATPVVSSYVYQLPTNAPPYAYSNPPPALPLPSRECAAGENSGTNGKKSQSETKASLSVVRNNTLLEARQAEDYARVLSNKQFYILAINKNWRRAATVGSDGPGSVTLWNIGSSSACRWKILRVPYKDARPKSVLALTFGSPESDLFATGSEDGTATMWNLNSGQTRNTVRTKAGNPIQTLAFNADESVIATGDSVGKVRLFDTVSGEELWSSPDRDQSECQTNAQLPCGIDAIVFSPDPAVKLFVSVGNNDEAVLWNYSNRYNTRQIETIAKKAEKSETRFRTLVAFSDDGQRLAVARNTSGSVWELNPLKKVMDRKVSRAQVTAMTLNKDGTKILTGTGDGFVTAHAVSLDDAIKLAWDLKPQPFTTAECESLVQDAERESLVQDAECNDFYYDAGFNTGGASANRTH